MCDILENILHVIFLLLLEEKEENNLYWDRVYSDEDHSLFYAIRYLRKKMGLNKEAYLDPLVRDMLASLSEHAKRNRVYKHIHTWMYAQDSIKFREDLLSGHSLLLECISNLLRVNISFFHGTSTFIEYSRTSTEYSPEDSSMRPGKALMLYYHPYKQIVEKIDPSSYHMPNIATTSIPLAKILKYDKIKEEYDSASESDSTDEVVNKKDHPAFIESQKDLIGLLHRDLDVSDTNDEDGLEIENKKKRKYKKPKIEDSVPIVTSDNVKNLSNFTPAATLFEEELSQVRANLQHVIIVSEKWRDHAQTLLRNVVPESIDNCACCPRHCAIPLHKATRGRRGPKIKKRSDKTE